MSQEPGVKDRPSDAEVRPEEVETEIALDQMNARAEAVERIASKRRRGIRDPLGGHNPKFVRA